MNILTKYNDDNDEKNKARASEYCSSNFQVRTFKNLFFRAKSSVQGQKEAA